MIWEVSSIGEYAKVISGYAFKSADFKKDSDVPIIKIKNIRHGFVNLDNDYTVESRFLKLDEKFHCNKGDIMISLTGSHITLPNSVVGRVAKYQFEETSLLNQRAGKVIVNNPDKLYQPYLYYQLNRPEIRIKLAQFGRGGANQVNISPSNVESVKIPIPPLPTQKKIANILSDYDDLIENNLKRIKLLEEAAQHIYKEWFVHFRFPNHEQTEMDKETGLPKGWKKGCVDDLCNVSSGYAFKSKEWREEGLPVVKIKNLDNNIVDLNDTAFIDIESAKKALKYELYSGDVLIAMTGATVGKIGIVPNIDYPIYLNQRVGLFRKLEKTDYTSLVYAFFLTSNSRQQVDNLAQGAAQPNISKKQIGSIELHIATSNVMNDFCEIAESMKSQIQSLYTYNMTLKEARDILLPRLMIQTITV